MIFYHLCRNRWVYITFARNYFHYHLHYCSGINVRNYRQRLSLKIWWNFRFVGFVMKNIAWVNAIKTFVGKRQFGHHHYTSPIFYNVSLNDLLPFVQKPLGIHHIRSKLFSLPLSKLHALYNSCWVNNVTNLNSKEYKLTSGINVRNYRQRLSLKIWWNFRFVGFVMKNIA
jgi:hypothetical protein